MPYLIFKRIFDIFGACVLLVVTLPLWALIIPVLYIAQGGPIFFRQQRVGLYGNLFTLLKFRTMDDGTPPRLPHLPVAKAQHDPRVTPFGQILRRSSLDELPQVVNILRGEMSLVGPRPLPADDLAQPEWLQGVDQEERARREDWATRRHEVLPGLLGLWQISANPADDFENWIICDLTYVERRSCLLDMIITLKAPLAVLRGRKPNLHPHHDRP